MIAVPSSVKDFDNPEMASDIERFMRSGSADARSCMAVMRLAWDFIGSELVSGINNTKILWRGHHSW